MRLLLTAVACRFVGTVGGVVSGTGGLAPVTATLSSEALPIVPSIWLVYATPIRIELGSPVSVTVPRCVQFTPSLEKKPRTTLPARSTRIQRGNVSTVSPLSPALEPPLLMRYWNDAPLPAPRNIVPWRELAASDSRTIKPTLLHTWALVRFVTRAVIWPSPSSGR